MRIVEDCTGGGLFTAAWSPRPATAKNAGTILIGY